MLHYEPPPERGALRQGELLGPVWQYTVEAPASSLPDDAHPTIERLKHGLVIVLAPDCDLHWDFEKIRSVEESAAEGDPAREHENRSSLPWVLLVDVHEEADIKTRLPPGGDLWRRIKQNQDERYHCFDGAPIHGSSKTLDPLYIDFKKAFSVPTRWLYAGLAADVTRIALVPSGYIHDLVQRFFAFQSRVALPE